MKRGGGGSISYIFELYISDLLWLWYRGSILLCCTSIRESKPWSGNKWCLFLEYSDRSTITRFRAKSKDDVTFVSSSDRLYMLCAKHE